MEKPAVHQAFLYFVPEKVRLCQFLLLVCQHMLHESSSFNYASFVIIVQEQVVTDFLFFPYFCCILLFTQFPLEDRYQMKIFGQNIFMLRIYSGGKILWQQQQLKLLKMRY